MYKGLLEEIKERQRERLEHYKTNPAVGVECLQIDDIDALLSETAKLTAENGRLRGLLREVGDRGLDVTGDCDHGIGLCNCQGKDLASRIVTALKDEDQAQGSAKDGE